MNTKCVGVAVTIASALIGVSAFAEELGDNGTFAIGVDRMFGYVSDVQSYDNPTTLNGTTTTTSHYEQTTNNFAVFGRAMATEVAQVPRLSFDAFVGPGVTLGGSVMYDHYSMGSATDGTDSPAKRSIGLWLFSPRVGFAKMFTPQFGIWPRAGIMYVHTSTDDTTTDPTTGATTTTNSSTGSLYLTLDANVILAPVPHFAFTLGPTYDYLLSVSQSSTPAQTILVTNQKEHAIGVQAGIFAWF